MREIEQAMVKAIEDGRTWRQGNTTVSWSEFSWQEYCEVRLFGNRICEVWRYDDGEGWRIRLSDAGWQSATTKSRLNALLVGLVDPRMGIFQRDWEWFLVGVEGSYTPWVSGLPFEARRLDTSRMAAA